MKNLLIKLIESRYTLIFVLVISIITNIFSLNYNRKYKDYINRNHVYDVQRTISLLEQASGSIEDLKTVADTDYEKAEYLFKASGEISIASRYVQDFSIYFNLMDKESTLRGNPFARDFFRAYTKVLEAWALATLKDLPEKPTTQDIDNIQQDIQNIIKKLEEHSDELDMDILFELLRELADETSTEYVEARYPSALKR